MIALRNPPVFHVLAYTYATVWFTTPFLAASLLLSADPSLTGPKVIPGR